MCWSVHVGAVDLEIHNTGQSEDIRVAPGHSGKAARSRDVMGAGGFMKATRYFQMIRTRPDRATIRDKWIERTITNPVRRFVQADGRIRCWAPVPEAEDRYLRVVLLSDGEAVHNAFFDRGYVP